MSCALVDLFKTVVTNAFRKVLQGKNPKLRGGLELNGKIRDQRDDLIRRRIEMKNSSENQLLGLQNQFDRCFFIQYKRYTRTVFDMIKPW